MNQPRLDLVGERKGKPVYRLTEDFIYIWPVGGDFYRIVVKAGFETDAASVPRLAWSIGGILPDGLHRAAAVVHDFLYQHKGDVRGSEKGSFCKMGPRGTWEEVDAIWSRQECDRLFMRMMKAYGVPMKRTFLMYWSVRAFGLPFWHNWLGT